MDRKGMHDTNFLWVTKPELRELGDLELAIGRREDEVGKYLETRHGSQWLQHFEKKSKRATWAELTSNGSDYPQLSTFYGHVRSSGIERVLKEYLRYDKVGTVSRLLRLDDAELTARVAFTRALKNKLAAKSDQVKATGFR